MLNDTLLRDLSNVEDLRQLQRVQAELEATMAKNAEVAQKMAEIEQKVQAKRRLAELAASRAERDEEQDAGISLGGIGGQDDRQDVPPRRGGSLGMTPIAGSTPYQHQRSARRRESERARPRDDPDRSQSQQAPALKMPSMPLPKYKPGDDWDDFLVEFHDLTSMVGMGSPQLLPYLKQCVTEEGRQLIVKKRVKSLSEAIGILTELYVPNRDSLTLFSALEGVAQKPGEKLQTFASRIESVVRQHIGLISAHITEAEIQKVICTKFRKSLSDVPTRNALLWDQDCDKMTLRQIIARAQKFMDERAEIEKNETSPRPKRGLRTTDEDSELVQLRAKVDELQKTLSEVLSGRRNDPSSSRGRGGWNKPNSQAPPRQPKKKFSCWNCGEEGHRRRDCTSEKIQDGYTYSNWRKPRQPRSEVTCPDAHLNEMFQG